MEPTLTARWKGSGERAGRIGRRVHQDVRVGDEESRRPWAAPGGELR